MGKRYTEDDLKDKNGDYLEPYENMTDDDREREVDLMNDAGDDYINPMRFQ